MKPRGLFIPLILAVSFGSVCASQKHTPLVIKRRPAVDRKVLPFTIKEAQGVARKRMPVRGGIPLLRGELLNPEHARILDEKDREVPCHTLGASRWPQGEVKWLIVDFTADLEAHQTRTLKLEFGSAVRKEAGGLEIAETDDAVTVDTGVVTVKFPKTGPHLIASIKRKDGKASAGPVTSFMTFSNSSVTDKELRALEEKFGRVEKIDFNKPIDEIKALDKQNARAVGAFMRARERMPWPKTTPTSERHRAKPIIDSVKVVERGPGAATLRIDGWLRDLPRLECELIIWVHVYAGSDTIWLEHAWRFLGWSCQDFVRDYGLEIKGAAGEDSTCSYGVDGDKGGLIAMPGGEQVRLVQYGSKQFLKRGGDGKGGERLAGWVDLSDAGGGVTAAVGNAWENWPVAFEADGELGTLRLSLFGGRDEDFLDLRSQLQFNEGGTDKGNLDVTEYPRSYICSKVLGHTYGGGGLGGEAKGLMKTHNVALRVHAGDAKSAGAPGLAQGMDQRPLPYTSPEHVAASRVFGFMTHFKHGPEFQKMANYMQAVLDFSIYLREAADLTGFVDFGDQPSAGARFVGGPDRMTSGSVVRGGWEIMMSGGNGWNNSERSSVSYLVYYALTGKEDYAHWGYKYLKHHADIDCAHWTAQGGKHGRGIAGRHNQVHWRGRSGYAGMTRIASRQMGYRGFHYAWRMFGDRRWLWQIYETSHGSWGWLRDPTLKRSFGKVQIGQRMGPSLFPQLLTYYVDLDKRWIKWLPETMRAYCEALEEGRNMPSGWAEGPLTKDGKIDWRFDQRLYGSAGGKSQPIGGYTSGYGVDDYVIDAAECLEDKDAQKLVRLWALRQEKINKPWSGSSYHCLQRVIGACYGTTRHDIHLKSARSNGWGGWGFRQVPPRFIKSPEDLVFKCYGKNSVLITCGNIRDYPFVAWAVALASGKETAE